MRRKDRVRALTSIVCENFLVDFCTSKSLAILLVLKKVDFYSFHKISARESLHGLDFSYFQICILMLKAETQVIVSLNQYKLI